MKKFYSIVFFLMLLTSVVNAADRYSVATGNWNSAATWSATSGGAAGASAPVAGDVVTIEGGFTVTITANAACATLNVNTGSLVVGGFNLTVTATTTVNGTLTVNNVTGTKIFDNLIINSGGIFNSTVNESFSLTGSLTINGTGSITSGTGAWTFSGASTLGGTGSATISNADFTTDYTNSGTYTFADVDMAGGGTVTLTNNGTINVSNSITGEEFTQGATGTLNFSGASIAVGSFVANAAGNIVNYNGAAQTIYSTTYSDLTLSGSNVKTIGADFTVNGNVTINSGVTLTAPAGGSDDISIGGNWVNDGTFNAGDDLVTFIGASQTIGGTSATTFNNLTISSSTATTLTINTSVAGNLNITSGDFFDLSTFTCNRTAAGGTLTVAGTMRLAADAGGQTGSNYPANFTTSTLTAGTVEYNGSNAITQTIFSTPTYENIVLTNGSGSGVANKIMTGSITMNGTLTVNANTVLTPGATNNFLAGSTNTITGTGTIKVTRIAATPDYVSQYDFDTDDLDQLTVDYAGAGNQTINGFTYGSLITSGSGSKTMGAASIVNDNLTIGAGTSLIEEAFTVSLSSATINIDGTLDFNDATGTFTTISGTSILTIGSDGLIRTVDPNGLGPAANASFIQNGGTTFTTSTIASNGTVEYYRSATSGQVVTDRDYNNLIISGNTQIKTWTLGATRTINGNITISANAPFTLANTQTINLKGNWENNSTGTFTPGTTVINLNGSSVQDIRGSQSTTFSFLTVNNVAGVTLSNDVNVSGNMTFTSGVVTSTSTNILTINDGATVSGASNSSYVDGPMIKLGNDDFTFPIGDPLGSYHPLRLVNTAGGSINGTNTDSYTAEYFRASATALGTVSSPFYGVSNCEYWTLARNAGSSTPNLHLSWTADSPCPSPSSRYVTSLTGLTVARLNAGNWQPADGTNQAATGTVGLGGAGTVADNNISLVGTFALGNTAPEENPLPVKLGNIKAYEKLNGVQIDWTAYTETAVDKYVIERSSNGSDFTAIGNVAALNSQNETHYGFFDASPLPGISYYRLRNIDIDGKSSLSNIVRIDLGKGKKDIVLYPNPVRSGGYISYGSADLARGNYSAKIFNAAGQQVFVQQFSHNGGAINQTIQLPASVRSGYYTLQLDKEGTKVAAKTFMVQ